MAKATSLILSLFDVASFRDVPFEIMFFLNNLLRSIIYTDLSESGSTTIDFTPPTSTGTDK